MAKNEKTTKESNTRTLTGEVVSNKMDKTIVVRVDRTAAHPMYGKRYTRSNTFHVHDENNSYEPGDMVVFEECRPISKKKQWRVIGKKEA